VKKYFESLKKFLTQSDNLIICGHENPDPDAICSCIAAEYLFSSMGKNVVCLNSDEMPFNLKPFDYRNIVTSVEEGAEPPENLEDYSMVILDTNDLNNIGTIAETVVPHIKNYFIIDHHSYKIDNVDEHFLSVSASSTCEIVYSIFENFGVEVPKEVGDAVYAGILFDSGSFHYPKTSAYTLNVASKIIDKGTSPNEIYLQLFEHESIESLKILSYVLSSLELHYDNQIAVLNMPRELLEKSGAKYEECQTIINIPLRCHNIKACIFFKENLESVKRVSMRSKGEIDVAKLAILYAGGGHKNAAGFKIKHNQVTFDDILPNLLSYLEREVDKENGLV
jgi:phosphoesterase RecJ-like protein